MANLDKKKKNLMSLFIALTEILTVFLQINSLTSTMQMKIYQKIPSMK